MQSFLHNLEKNLFIHQIMPFLDRTSICHLRLTDKKIKNLIDFSLLNKWEKKIPIRTEGFLLDNLLNLRQNKKKLEKIIPSLTEKYQKSLRNNNHDLLDLFYTRTLLFKLKFSPHTNANAINKNGLLFNKELQSFCSSVLSILNLNKKDKNNKETIPAILKNLTDLITYQELKSDIYHLLDFIQKNFSAYTNNFWYNFIDQGQLSQEKSDISYCIFSSLNCSTKKAILSSLIDKITFNVENDSSDAYLLIQKILTQNPALNKHVKNEIFSQTILDKGLTLQSTVFLNLIHLILKNNHDIDSIPISLVKYLLDILKLENNLDLYINEQQLQSLLNIACYLIGFLVPNQLAQVFTVYLTQVDNQNENISKVAWDGLEILINEGSNEQTEIIQEILNETSASEKATQKIYGLFAQNNLISANERKNHFSSVPKKK